MYEFLPYELRQYAIENRGNLFELRIRENCFATANLRGEYVPVVFRGEHIKTMREDIDSIIYSVAENSIYNCNECIKNGYITASGGIRIGIGGSCVFENNKIITLKNFSSLCIRFPNKAVGCSDEAYSIITKNNDVKNTLVISAPGVGKTTLLRDLIRNLSLKLRNNILVIDEKNELAINDFDSFYTVDVIRGGTKKFGFYTAIKTLSPQIIIADEIIDEEDLKGVAFAINSGVKVICSVHGNSFEDIMKKDFFKPALKNKIFECFLLLKKTAGGFLTFDITPYRE